MRYYCAIIGVITFSVGFVMAVKEAQALFDEYGSVLISNSSIKNNIADPALDALLHTMIQSTQTWNTGDNKVILNQTVRSFTLVMSDFCILLWDAIEQQKKSNSEINSFNEIANKLVRWLNTFTDTDLKDADFESKFTDDKFQFIGNFLAYNAIKDQSLTATYITGEGIFKELGIKLSQASQGKWLKQLLGFRVLESFETMNANLAQLRQAMGVSATTELNTEKQTKLSTTARKITNNQPSSLINNPSNSNVLTSDTYYSGFKNNSNLTTFSASKKSQRYYQYSSVASSTTTSINYDLIVKKLSDMCKKYKKHLDSCSSSYTDKNLQDKKAIIDNLIDLLDSSGYTSEVKFTSFKTKVSDVKYATKLKPRRDASENSKYLEYLFHIITLGFYSKYTKGTFAFWKSHGEALVDEMENTFKMSK